MELEEPRRARWTRHNMLKAKPERASGNENENQEMD